MSNETVDGVMREIDEMIECLLKFKESGLTDAEQLSDASTAFFTIQVCCGMAWGAKIVKMKVPE